MGESTALLIILLILIIYRADGLTQGYLLNLLPRLGWTQQGMLLQTVRQLGPPTLLDPARGGTAVWRDCLFKKVVLTDSPGRCLSAFVPLHFHYSSSSGFAGGNAGERGVVVGEKAKQAYIQAARKHGVTVSQAGGTLHAESWKELCRRAGELVTLMEGGVPYDFSPFPPLPPVLLGEEEEVERYLTMPLR